MAITINGSGITSANIADGAIVDADVSDLAASKLTGALPAISGASLTSLTSSQVDSGSTTAKAWVNFNGTGVVAIRASFNVSSITDNATGDYTVNFTNAMPDVNYSPMFGASPAAGFSGSVGSWWLGVSLDGSGIPRTKTTSALRIISTGASGSLVDSSEVNLSIFR